MDAIVQVNADGSKGEGRQKKSKDETMGKDGK